MLRGENVPTAVTTETCLWGDCGSCLGQTGQGPSPVSPQTGGGPGGGPGSAPRTSQMEAKDTRVQAPPCPLCELAILQDPPPSRQRQRCSPDSSAPETGLLPEATPAP